MPISSFHGLRRNSVPAKPWNSTKTSPQRTIPRDGLIRKRSLGVPRLWEHDFQVVDELQDDAQCYKSSHSSFVPQKSEKTARKFSLNLKSRNERQTREIKRRDTFPKFEISSRRTSEKVLKRSKTDSSISVPKKTVSKFKVTDSKSPKRPTSLWTTGKREERSSAKFRKRKLGNTISPLSSISSGSVEKNLLLRQGDRIVCILNRQPQLGILKYLGTTHFADGEWCGILLENPCGKNDGSVRGVRYFRCRNKHGIFVHSYKVKRADEVDLSKLNLTTGYSSPESSGNPVNTAVNTDSTMAASEVSVVVANQMICKHWDVKSQRLSRRKYRRNRSISLDRYLLLTTKYVTKGVNVFSQNTAKGDIADLWQKNCINRSVSLPRICQENNAKDSNEFCLAGELEPLEMKPLQETNRPVLSKEGKQIVDPDSTLSTDSSPSVNSGTKSDSVNANVCLNNNAVHVVSKVGHAVSLDTHLMIQNKQLIVCKNGKEDEVMCHSNVSTNDEDPFIQGRHCSCPSLHCADHFSEAIKTCLELGRTERSVISEASQGSVVSTECSFKSGTQFGLEPRSHSHSEALETLFWKSKISGAHSKLGRKGSWPWVSTPKQSLRGYGSSDDIDPTEMVSKDDLSNKRLNSTITGAKPISSVGVEKHLNLESVSSDADIHSVNQAVVLLQMEAKDQSLDADSINTGSLSGSQTSLSSTGTSSSKGKKISPKKQIPSSVKGSITKPKALSSNGVTLPKVKQKQSRLEQIRQQQQQQQQQNRHSSVSSSVQKPSSANKTNVVAESNKKVKQVKRHTLAGISDVKSSVPRPTLNKRVTSDGIPLVMTASSNDDAKSRLPVKKEFSSLVSQPVALLKGKVSVERKNSSSAGRATVKRNSSLAESDSKPSKQSTVGKVSNIAVPSTSGTTRASSKGPKGVTAAGSKSQTSQVAKPSGSTKAKAAPVKDSRSQPSSISTKKIPQLAKQNVKNHPANVKQGTSKLPRKVSAQLSNASDSASVTSSVKDQLDDNLEDFRDTESNSGSVSPDKPGLSKRVSSEAHFPQDEVDARVSSPFEMSSRIMPPDLLSQTPYLSKHSIGIQVDNDDVDGDDSKTILSLKEKVQHLDEILKQRTDLCGQLQNQLDKDSKDFITVSIMILSVVSEMQLNKKYCSQLERKIQSVKQEMNVVQEKLAEEEANSVKLQEEMMYQRSEHTVAIETLKADYENLLERTSSELKNKHEGEIALAIETHKLQIKEIHQQHENEISQVKKSHEELVASLKEQHRDEIVELESKHSSAFDELVEEHQVEIETIKADYDEQQTEFKEKYEKLASEWNSLNKKFQQVQDQNQKDIETRLQEEIKKYESLPAELESIKAVLEMKNEEIRQLRKEKMEKHLELENLVDIKEKTKRLQQENESLSFVVETKSKFERQLSVERDTLRNSLERESAKSKRLSLENEELQWRLVNSTSPPNSPNVEERPLPALSNRNSFRLSASFPDPEVIDE